MSVTTSAQQILADASTGSSGELPEAYWELIDHYRGELVNQALSITGSMADAEDIVQETFCEAVTKGMKMAEVRSLGAWLRSINKANALNRLRSRLRDAGKNERQNREAPKRAVTTGGFSAVELRESVATAIEDLPEKFRRPIILRYWQQLSCEQIAERLQTPVGTVKWLLFEAASRLHGSLNVELEGASVTPGSESPAQTEEQKVTNGEQP